MGPLSNYPDFPGDSLWEVTPTTAPVQSIPAGSPFLGLPEWTRTPAIRVKPALPPDLPSVPMAPVRWLPSVPRWCLVGRLQSHHLRLASRPHLHRLYGNIESHLSHSYMLIMEYPPPLRQCPFPLPPHLLCQSLHLPPHSLQCPLQLRPPDRQGSLWHLPTSHLLPLQL